MLGIQRPMQPNLAVFQRRFGVVYVSMFSEAARNDGAVQTTYQSPPVLLLATLFT